MTSAGRAWEARTERMPLDELPAHLRREGFSIVLVNRNGYKDRGEAITQALLTGPDRATVLIESGEYVALDLRRAAAPRP